MRLFRSPRRPPLCLALESVCLGALLAVAPAGSAQAQSYQTVGEGLTVGRFVLYPSLSLEYTRDSNIFYTPSDLPGTGATSSGIVVARPRILADLPFGQSRIRLAYAPFYRDYTNETFQGSSRLNQAFDLEGLIRSGGALTIGIRDHFVRGTVSLQDQGDRSGLTFGLGRYSTHTPQMEIGVNSGGRQGFSLIPSYSRSSFTGISESVHYGYTTRKLEGRYNYRVSEPSTLYGYYGLERTTQTQAGTEDVGIHSRSFGLGIRRMVNEKVVTLMSVGYQALDFEGGGGQNFGGLIVEASASLQVDDVTRIEVAALRQPYPSVYTNKSYYIATEGRAHVTRQIGRAAYLDATLTFQESLYAAPQGTTARRDRSVRLGFGTGYQFLRSLRAYLGYEGERRESNVEEIVGGSSIDPFRYSVNRVLFRLEAGWL